jgi:hypothetical protein
MFLVEFELPGTTQAQYEKIWAILREKKLLTPKGRTHHFGAPAPGGFRVIDVWADMADFEAFGQVLVPAMIEVGMTPPTPRVLPIAKAVIA